MRKLRQLTNSHIESFKAQAVSLNTPVWYQGHDSIFNRSNTGVSPF